MDSISVPSISLTDSSIPKIIHQVWLSKVTKGDKRTERTEGSERTEGEDVPSKYQEYIQQKKKKPTI